MSDGSASSQGASVFERYASINVPSGIDSFSVSSTNVRTSSDIVNDIRRHPSIISRYPERSLI
ncbi:MAG: hypothetical protein ACLVJ6_02065 [Merdibacter sp.]